MCVFQDLYDSEINFNISAMWDGGFNVEFGQGEDRTAHINVNRFGSIEPWLIGMACHYYPRSEFAKMYGGQAGKTYEHVVVDKQQEVRQQALYVAQQCAGSNPTAVDVISAADKIEKYIVSGTVLG